jgi:hypothetical protein
VAEIVVDISPDGEIRIEGRGFSGPECYKATAALEAALGKITKDQKSPEYYQVTGQKAKMTR